MRIPHDHWTRMYRPGSHLALMEMTRRALAEDARHSRECDRFLLPASGDEMYRARATYGWTGMELLQICEALTAAGRELCAAAEHVALEGTAATLRRDASRYFRMAKEWAGRHS